MDKSPKRRKYKDNPYSLMIENNLFYVLFTDNKNIIHKIKVSEEIFNVFSDFELDDKKLLNEYDRHIEHNELSEITLNKRAVNKTELVDIIVEKKLEDDLLRNAINSLSDVQKRRIIKYYFENKTLEQIGREEGCNKMAVKFSLDSALEKISKKFKI